MVKRTKTINKKAYKKIAGCCRVCKTDLYELLDVHRIFPGSDGGRYIESNVVCLCSNCHRKNHAGLLTIDRWYYSTGGYLLRIIEEGKERFV